MTVSSLMRGVMFAQDTGNGLLVLLTIDHDDLAQPIRVVNNQVDVSSRGDLFTAFPFDIVLPEDEPDVAQVARLILDNISREITQAIRTISSAATVLVEVVQLKDPEAVEIAYPSLNLRNVRWDSTRVTGDLMSDDLHLEPCPGHHFSPTDFPGILGG